MIIRFVFCVGLGLTLANSSHAQQCEAACEAQYQSCAQISAAGCDLAAQGAQRLADQALSNIPYGGLASQLLGGAAKSTCQDKLAPCQSNLESCNAACVTTSAAVTGAAAAAASMTNVIVYSDTTGATVYIDEQRAGVTSSDTNAPFQSPPLLPGSHRIRVVKGSGAQVLFWEGDVQLVPGKINSVETGTLKSIAWWANTNGEQALLARQVTLATAGFATAWHSASASSEDKERSEEGLLKSIAMLVSTVNMELDARSMSAEQAWQSTTWAPGVRLSIDNSLSQEARTLLEALKSNVGSAAVHQECDRAMRAMEARLQDDAHAAWLVVDGMDRDRFAQYGAATAWLAVFPDGADAPTARQLVAEIDSLRDEHIRPILAQLPASLPGTDLSSALARRTAGQQIARRYSKIERLGMQGFIDSPLLEASIWAPPSARADISTLWFAEHHRRPNRALRHWGYALAWTGVPVVALGATLGWQTNTIQYSAYSAMMGGGMVALSSPLQARHLQSTYGSVYPTQGEWSDRGTGLYALGGMSIGAFYLSKGIVVQRAANREDFGSPAQAASNLNMLRAMGISFVALGATTSVLRHTSLGKGAGKSVSVQVSPFGIQGAF